MDSSAISDKLTIVSEKLANSSDLQTIRPGHMQSIKNKYNYFHNYSYNYFTVWALVLMS